MPVPLTNCSVVTAVAGALGLVPAQLEPVVGPPALFAAHGQAGRAGGVDVVDRDRAGRGAAGVGAGRGADTSVGVVASAELDRVVAFAEGGGGGAEAAALGGARGAGLGAV